MEISLGFLRRLLCFSRSEDNDHPQPPSVVAPQTHGATDSLQHSPSHTDLGSSHLQLATKAPYMNHTNPQSLGPLNDHMSNTPQVMTTHTTDTNTDGTTPASPIPPCSISADPTVFHPQAPLDPCATNMRPMIGHPVRFKRNIFAIIIGIDDYTGCQKLKGAVADAQSFKSYFEEDLKIPGDQIRTLFDSEASREAIIQAFQDVENDGRIKENDPIVIFYAGHGGEIPAPPLWGTLALVAKIQCLVPQDYKESVVPPIPDRTIGALIENIAAKKGDNICVILDCCHSASGTRVKNDAYTPRTVTLNCTIHGDLDIKIWARVGKIPPGFARRGLLSHVLFAACGEKELAYEHHGRGLFTTELLNTLKNNAMDDLTYIEVLERIQRIHFVTQNPHCEGFNQYRVIFDVKVPAGRQVRHSVCTHESGRYVLGAGLAQGIRHGVEFTLFSDQKQILGAIGVDEAAVIDDFQTMVTVPKYPENVSFAKVNRVGDLPIYPTPGGDSSRILEETLRRMHASGDVPTFRLVRDINEANLGVGIENGLAVLKVLDPQLKRFGMAEVSFNVTLDRLVDALSAAAHYYWYLDLRREDVLAQNDGVVIDFYLLEESETEYSLMDGLPLWLPVEGPGFRTRDDANEEVKTMDIIDFVVNEDKPYGIKITNNTARDLYLNAFLFNNSSLSIVQYYTQPTPLGANKPPDPPLKHNGVFLIGYGPGGTVPFTYSLDEGQDIDVGYLKIYFATRPIDLSDIVQVSPFSVTNTQLMDEEGRKARLKAQPVMQPSLPTDTWFTVGMPVVQRRQAKQAGI